MADACEDGEDNEMILVWMNLMNVMLRLVTGMLVAVAQMTEKIYCTIQTLLTLESPGCHRNQKSAQYSNCSPSSSASCRRRAGALQLSSLFVRGQDKSQGGFP